MQLILAFSLLVAATHAMSQSSLLDKFQEEALKHPPKDEPIHIEKTISKDAYATFLCSRPEFNKGDDIYFYALLLWLQRLRMINTPDYNTTPRDVIVLLCNFTPQDQIKEIEALGAIVVSVDPIVPQGRHPDFPPLIDQFTKYQLWRLTDWDRILYLDIDAFFNKNLLDIWSEPAAQIITEAPANSNGAADMYPYLMAGIQDCSCRIDACKPPFHENYLNGGVFMLKPSLPHFRALIAKMNKNDEPRNFMEQNVLNAFYSDSSPYPWKRLPIKYDLCYDFPVEVREDVAVMHCKLWVRDYSHMKIWHDQWWWDFDHLVKGRAQSLERVYLWNETVYVHNPNSEAYVFILRANDPADTTSFMNFESIKVSIAKLNEVLKYEPFRRDVIVLAADSVPIWQMQALQELGAIALRVKPLSRNNADTIKPFAWKLTQWKRLLVVESDMFIRNKDILREIWKPQVATNTIEGTGENSKNNLYPYLFAAMSNKEGGFYPGMIMIKPSHVHFDQMLKTWKSNEGFTEEELLNNIYKKDGSLPWAQITAVSYDRSIKSSHKNSKGVAVLDSQKAYQGQIWALNSAENRGMTLVEEFWKTYDKVNSELQNKSGMQLKSSKKCLEGCERCEELKDGDFNNLKCKSCSSGYKLVESYKIYNSYSASSAIKSLQIEEPSKNCLECLKEDKGCSTCELSDVKDSASTCVLTSGLSDNNIFGVCGPCAGAGCRYVKKITYCVSTTPGKASEITSIPENSTEVPSEGNAGNEGPDTFWIIFFIMLGVFTICAIWRVAVVCKRKRDGEKFLESSGIIQDNSKYQETFSPMV